MLDKRFELSESACKKAKAEIENCQKRIIQIMAPTIVAFGITGISSIGEGSGENILFIFLALFAVLFSSSLYIASLSYKIFKNAAYLRKYAKKEDWEKLMEIERGLYRTWFIGTETSAIGCIYILLSVIFGIIFPVRFWMTFTNLLLRLLPIICVAILFAVALLIWMLPRPFMERRMNKRIEKVVNRYLELEGKGKGA